MFNFHKNHKNLVTAAFLGFVTLSIVIAILPALQMQASQALPEQNALNESERRGLEIFVAENCMACHTQQVRNIEMDKVWGERPSIPSDYYYSKQRLDFWRQSPSLLGSERTGPDLTNVGKRQPAKEWHLLHLYNPRIVVKESIMPSYPWLFETKSAPNDSDVIIPVPLEFLEDEKQKIVATQDVLDLVAYLQSLKQTPLPEIISSDFIPAVNKTQSAANTDGNTGKTDLFMDGEKLYTQNCAPCHQSNGMGLAGAFPALAGSNVVNNEDFDLMIRIILQGYDARSEFSQMPGFATALSDAEIAAIANHERKSWGNNASEISTEEVQKIRELVMKES